MISNAGAVAALAAVVAGLLAGGSAVRADGPTTTSCTQQQVQSSSGGQQSNSSTVVQTSQGGSASCSSTVQQTNQTDSQQSTVLSGSGSRSTTAALTTALAARWAQRIARGVDPAARHATPHCRRTGPGRAHCSLRWTHAHLRIAFRAGDERVSWTYRGTVTSR